MSVRYRIAFPDGLFERQREIYADKDRQILLQGKQIDHMHHVIAGLKGHITKLNSLIWKLRSK